MNKSDVMAAPTAKAAVTVAGTSTAVLAENRARTHAIIQAAWDNTEPIFLAFGGAAAVVDVGFGLYPGQHYQIGADNYTFAAITGICTSGGQTAYVFEA